MTTVALIPAYQPDDRLVGLVCALREREVACVVVDDGSGPAFAPVFAAAGTHAAVIGYERNCGKGHALKCGLRYIRNHYPEDAVVVTVDADGQHAVGDVMRCAEEAAGSPDALVLGSRAFAGAGVPLRSRLGNVITRWAFRLATGLRVRDTQTGLRAFSVRSIDLLGGIEGERYEFEMNMLLACPTNEIEVREVPIETIYEQGNPTSHFRPLRDSLLVYGGMLAFAASSLASFLVDYALFSLLSLQLGPLGARGIAAANVGARIVSATTNFLVNRYLVFRSTQSLYVAAVRYGLLALGVLLGNTCAMVLLCDAGVSATAAKLVVEALFFVLSWVMQSRVVFRGRHEKAPARIEARTGGAMAARLGVAVEQGR